MKILVTGGAGFIGSHVADAYLEDGHEVAVIDSLLTGSRRNINPNVHFFQADVRDAERVHKICADFRPDAISHHAAQISVPHSVENPAYDAEVNVLGILNLWRGARDAGAQRFIFASSGGAIYGDAKELPVAEGQPPAPLSPYGLSKQVSEMYLRQLAPLGEMVPVILRYANVYGPRQGARGEAGVVSIFVRRLLNGQRCTIYGDGSMTRDYVFVKDVAAANRQALTLGDGQEFNIASTTQTTTLQLYSTICEQLGIGTHPDFVPERPGDVRFSCLDSNRARAGLNWEPRVELTQGLQQVIDYCRENPLESN